MRRLWLCLVLCLLVFVPAHAQDGLNLPSELYVLLNSGLLQRVGLGASGIQTVTPEDAFVLDFGVAPDGQWVAYRTQDGLFLTDMASDKVVTVEGLSAGVPPIRGRGDTIAWSPQGDAVAYTTLTGARVYFNTGAAAFADLQTMQLLNLQWSPDGSHLAAEAENNIWWIFRRQDVQMLLVSAIPASFGTAWVGPAQLVFAPPEGALILMDMARGNAQTVLQDSTSVYRLPYLQRDGTLAVFGKSKQNTELGEDEARLLLVALDTLEVREGGQNAVNLAGLRWAPGGELLVAFDGSTLGMRSRVTGDVLFNLPLDSAVAYSWGPLYPESVVNIALPVNGFFMANGLNGAVQVWLLPRDGSPPTPLTGSETDVTAYAVSPDGRSLAYASDSKLWLLALDGENEPVQLAELPAGNAALSLAFSPDSRRIAYATTGSSENPEAGIWLFTTGEETPRLALANGPADKSVYAPPFYRDPVFAPNINALLVTIGGSETTQLGLLDLNTLELVTLGSYDAGGWIGGGQLVAYGNGIGIGSPPPTQDLYRLNPNSPGDVTLLASIPQPFQILALRETPQENLRLVLRQNRQGPSPLRVLDIVLDGGEQTPAGDAGFMVEPRLSPDGSFVAGYTSERGALVLVDLEEGRRVSLSSPVSVWGFEWASD